MSFQCIIRVMNPNLSFSPFSDAERQSDDPTPSGRLAILRCCPQAPTTPALCRSANPGAGHALGELVSPRTPRRVGNSTGLCNRFCCFRGSAGGGWSGRGWAEGVPGRPRPGFGGYRGCGVTNRRGQGARTRVHRCRSSHPAGQEGLEGNGRRWRSNSYSGRGSLGANVSPSRVSKPSSQGGPRAAGAMCGAFVGSPRLGEDARGRCAGGEGEDPHWLPTRVSSNRTPIRTARPSTSPSATAARRSIPSMRSCLMPMRCWCAPGPHPGPL